MLKLLLIAACIGHIMCGFCDCLLSYSKGRRLNLKDIKDSEKMSKMFEGMPLWQPMTSIIPGVFSITIFTFGYLALSSWMHKYNVTLSYVMLASAIVFVVPIAVHHVICGIVEWFYIKLGRTDEARSLVLGFQKETISTMFVGYLGWLVFLLVLFIEIVMGKTDLPIWACVFNTLPLMIILTPTKFAAKGNIAGALMFLGLAVLL